MPPPYDIDVRDSSFRRPKIIIRVSGPDGATLPPIEVDELVIDAETLTIDDTAKLEAARQICHFESAQAEQISETLRETDPVLSAAIRRELARRATRPQQPRTTPRSY